MEITTRIKDLGTILFIGARITLAQNPVSQPVVDRKVAKIMPSALPPYVTYHHFLSWVLQLEKESKDSGTGDDYQFAKAFSRANLQHEQLDILRSAAHQLDDDLKKHQVKAKNVIDLYRKQAGRLAAEGKPLPPAPPEVHRLEIERTAILINQYVSLQRALGPDFSPTRWIFKLRVCSAY